MERPSLIAPKIPEHLLERFRQVQVDE